MKTDAQIATDTGAQNKGLISNAGGRNTVRLEQRISVIQSARLAHFARTRNTTRSVVIRALLDRLPASPAEADRKGVQLVTVDVPKPKARFQPKTKKLSLRLSPDEYDRLSEYAKAYGSSRLGFISRAWRAAVLKQPQLLEVELIELRAAVRELNAVGTNLNQIARRLNEIATPPDGLLETLTRCIAVTRRQREAIDLTVKASEERWG